MNTQFSVSLSPSRCCVATVVAWVANVPLDRSKAEYSEYTEQGRTRFWRGSAVLQAEI